MLKKTLELLSAGFNEAFTFGFLAFATILTFITYRFIFWYSTRRAIKRTVAFVHKLR